MKEAVYGLEVGTGVGWGQEMQYVSPVKSLIIIASFNSRFSVCPGFAIS